ncbi:hypothetical protein ACIBH1_11960 [Nonomuraea sp. NPDC050663]|uniref:hypothetical protein n=1 Tax=Nonomuraea sp. NPDC050663 TaxID=3364370 RepID=UPI0037A1DCD1
MRLRMLPLLLGLAAALTVGIPGTAPAAAPTPEPLDHYVIPGDRAFPVGLAYDPRTGHYYTGSAADGTLYRGHVNKEAAEVWSPDGTDGRTVTAGMAMDLVGRLYVNGAATGVVRVYDPKNGELLAELTGRDGGFLNEITIADDGSAFVTDSMLPVIYRITERRGQWAMEPWLELTDSPIEWSYGQHNLNGILAVGHRHLLTVQSNTGRLWRIDRHTRKVTEVDLGGDLLPSGDALVSDDGRRVYVTQGNLYAEGNREPRVAVVDFSRDLTRAKITDSLIPPGGLLHPAQAALTEHGRLLVVNTQYNRFLQGLPPQSLPFTISSIPVPDRGRRSSSM